MRSQLARHVAAMRDPDPEAARRLARDGYHATGFVAIDPAWLDSWADQQQLKILADKVHGKAK